MTLTVNRDEVIAELRKVATGREDHIYKAPEQLTTCVYYEFPEYVTEYDGEYSYTQGVGEPVPSCVVGCVIDDLAKRTERPDLVRDETLQNNDDVGIESFTEQLAKVGLVFTPEAIKVLNLAQKHQDSGIPWGRAIDLAEQGRDSDDDTEEANA